jgi:hypothetical protein
MKNNTIYKLIVDGKEVARDTLLTGVAIKAEKVKDHYEIRKYYKGNIVKLWGYSIKDGNRVEYASHANDSTIQKTKIVQSKVSKFIGRVSNVLSTIKSEYRVRKNLKQIERKVDLWDFNS